MYNRQCRYTTGNSQQQSNKKYTTGETTEKLLSEKFRSEVRAYRKKRHQVLISFSHFWPEHYIITSRI